MSRTELSRLLGVAVVTTLVLTVVGAAPASAAEPVLDGVRLLNTSVDLSSEDGAVGVLLSGNDRRELDNAELTVRCTSCPGPDPVVEYGYGFAVDTSTGAVASVSVYLPQEAPAGTWQIDNISLLDIAADTQVYYDDAALTSKGFSQQSRTFTVTKGDPGVAPAATTVTFSQSPADVTAADNHVPMEVSVVDAVPGITRAKVTLSGPSGSSKVEHLDADYDLVQGSPRNGVLRTGLALDWSDRGSWTVSEVALTDRYGAVTVLTSAPAGGSWGQLDVTSSSNDTGAPTIAGTPTVSPTSVDVTVDDATVALTVSLQDDVSGFAHASVQFVDGVSSFSTSIIPDELTTGTIRDGTYVGRGYVYARTVPGTYTASTMVVRDRAGNVVERSLATPLTVTVSSDVDAAPPQLASLTLSSTTVNITGGTRFAHVFATVTDDASGPDDANDDPDDPDDGLAASTYTYTSPDGSSVTEPFDRFDRTSGTSTNGTYSLPVRVWQVGTHTLTGMTLVDREGRTTTLDAAALSQIYGAAPTFTAVDQQDTAAPTVTAVDVSPVTIASGPEHDSLSVRINAGDLGSTGEPSGISDITATFVSPDGQREAIARWQSHGGCEYQQCYVSRENDQGAVFTASLSLRPYAEAGLWRLTKLTVVDNSDNESTIVGADLGGVGGNKSFDVTGTGDNTPPTFSDLSFAPAPADATNGDHNAVRVSARSTDDLSGVTYAWLDLVSPSGWQYTSGQFETDEVQPEGLLAVDWVGSVNFPRYAESGDWTITAYVQDRAGNSRELTGAELTAAGMPATLSVTGVADSAAPMLASLEVSDVTVDSRTQDREVLFTIHATDAVSGMDLYDSVKVDMGEDSEYDDVYLFRDGGTSKDGWYSGVWVVAEEATPGSRPITVRLTDSRGNMQTVTSAALAAASLPSAISVTSGGLATPDGVIQGSVTGPSGPVAGAYVQACNQTYSCGSDTTDSAGAYGITGLRGGDYEVTVYPPTRALNSGSGAIDSLYTQPNHTGVVDVALTAPAPPLQMGSGTSVNGTTSGVPTVFYGEPFPLSTTGCTGGVAQYSVTQDGRILRSGYLLESATTPGTYETTVAELTDPGTATMTITIDCPGGTPNETETFSLYIDPSGFIYDYDGITPAPGAQVTLYRAETENGTYTQVPQDSTIMDPSNRQNPDTSDATGHYGWLTIAGWYRVDVTKPNCYRPGSYDLSTNSVASVTRSRLVQVPPEVTDLHVTIDCRNIAPVAAPTRTGGGSVPAGSNVSFTAGASDANGSVASYAWDFGDGSTGTGADPSHTYATAGTFTPKLTVTDNQGVTSPQISLPSISVAAPVVAPPVPPAAVAPAPPAAAAPSAPPASTADASAPTVSMGALGATTLGATAPVSWSGADNVGVSSYDVRYRTAAWNQPLGGYVSPPGLQTTAAKSTAQSVAAGATYCFSARSRDAAGNVSGWSAERCTAKPLDDRALLAKGAWAKSKGKAYFAGTIATSKAKNATLTKAGALPGRVALVAGKGKGFGKVGVYYNGKLVQTVNLAASKATSKAVIALPKLTKKGTITLKVLTAGKTVPIDGLLTARM